MPNVGVNTVFVWCDNILICYGYPIKGTNIYNNQCVNRQISNLQIPYKAWVENKRLYLVKPIDFAKQYKINQNI